LTNILLSTYELRIRLSQEIVFINFISDKEILTTIKDMFQLFDFSSIYFKRFWMFILLPTLIHQIKSISAQSSFMKQFAGSGTMSFAGDGGTATSAALSSPSAVFLDSNGNMFIADTSNHRIRKVSSTNIITTIAGQAGYRVDGDGGQATSAYLYGPRGIWVSTTGTIFIADSDNHRIRSISTAGIINTIAGMGVKGYPNGYSGDNGAGTSATMGTSFGMIGDSNGNLYYSDLNANRVRKISSSGIVTTFAGNGVSGFLDSIAATSANLKGPRGLGIDTMGNVYVADTSNYRIRKVTINDGIIFSIAGSGSSTFADGLASSAGISFGSFIWVDTIGQV
jgi:sugar lactone lactonase YvrE